MNLQTITITRMLSSGGYGRWWWRWRWWGDDNDSSRRIYALCYIWAQSSELIRHWSKLPVSVPADRWLGAGRHSHLIRVDATRSTTAAARQWLWLKHLALIWARWGETRVYDNTANWIHTVTQVKPVCVGSQRVVKLEWSRWSSCNVPDCSASLPVGSQHRIPLCACMLSPVHTTRVHGPYTVAKERLKRWGNAFLPLPSPPLPPLIPLLSPSPFPPLRSRASQLGSLGLCKLSQRV